MADFEGAIRPFCASRKGRKMEMAIVRAAHLHPYLDELREIGVPIERELACSRLPPWLLEDPDAHVSFALCLEWLAGCSRDIDIMEFGFRAARRASLQSLAAPLRRAILAAPTGIARLEALGRCAALEDNVLSVRLQTEGTFTRVISTMDGFMGNPFICLGEWVDIQAMISIIRTVAGPGWCPKEITFVSRNAPNPTVREAFPNTRLIVGQPCTSILISSELLSTPCRPHRGRSGAMGDLPLDAMPEGDAAAWNLATALRAAIRPYLADRCPTLPEMAEAFQTSPRTLQRRLQQCGLSYLEVVQEARFDLARELLHDLSARITDVALATGYGSQQHFARAFRRHAGVSPTLYRKSISEWV